MNTPIDTFLPTLNNSSALTATAGQPTSLALDPNGDYLYATYIIGSNVTVYSLQDPPTPPQVVQSGGVNNPYDCALHFGSNSSLLFVANLGSGISVYTIGDTGGLTAVQGSPFVAIGSQAIGGNVYGIAVDSENHYLYALTQDTNNDPVVSTCSFDENGQLTIIQQQYSVGSNSNQGGAIALSPCKNYLYVALATDTNPFGASDSGKVFVYPLSSGSLGPLATQSQAVPMHSMGSIVAHPNQPYLFVGSAPFSSPGSGMPANSIAGFSFANDELTPLPGSPYATSFTPTAFSIDGTNNILYAAGYQYSSQSNIPGFVASYYIDDTSGQIAEAVSPVSSVGDTPWSLASSESKLYVSNWGAASANSGINAFNTTLPLEVSDIESPLALLNSVAYGHNSFIIAGHQKHEDNNYVVAAMSSADGNEWQSLSLPSIKTNSHVDGIRFCNSTFAILTSFSGRGADSHIFMSPDGETWEKSTVSINGLSALTDIAWGNDLWVATGIKPFASGHYIVTSSDGVDWSASSEGPSVLRGIVFGNGVFVAVGRSQNREGYNSIIMSSTDGVHWTNRLTAPITYPMHTGLTAVIFNELSNIFVAVGVLGSIYTSPDGISWTLQPRVFKEEHSPTLNDISASETQPSLFVSLIDNNLELLVSRDSKHWSYVPADLSEGQTVHGRICWGDNTFLITGGTEIYRISF